MKGVAGMIRLHKWQLDVKRRELAGLENMRHDLLDRKKGIEQELMSERAAATNSEVGFAYASFAEASFARRRKLENSIAEVDVSIEAKKAEIAEIFQELKKFEILAERQVAREKVSAGRKMQADMDEISLNMYRRASLPR
jgi:flagellar export protein FliJ